MLKAELNQNEIAALRRLGGESILQSQDFQSAPITSSSLTSSSEVRSSMPIPDCPANGVVVKVEYSGACYTSGPGRKNKVKPQFPGSEVAGVVHRVGDQMPNCNMAEGDRVLVVAGQNKAQGYQPPTPTGYQEYLALDERRVVTLPDTVPLEVAAMLPGSALQAYTAVQAAKPHVDRIRQSKSVVNVMIVGGGPNALWAVKLAKKVLGPRGNGVRTFVADSCIERLLAAQEHGCHDIVYWNEEDHEEYIIERTQDSVRGGVDVVIDFIGSRRTLQRDLKVLNNEGLVLVGGGAVSVSVPLASLADRQQSIVGVPQGNLNQLMELINAVADNTVEVPAYRVFPVEEANQVFEDICESRVTARAVFKFGSQTSTHTVDNQ